MGTDGQEILRSAGILPARGEGGDVTDAVAEVRRLRGLVSQAFGEGFQYGGDTAIDDLGEAWGLSAARDALGQVVADG